jgi:hypothetical protein
LPSSVSATGFFILFVFCFRTYNYRYFINVIFFFCVVGTLKGADLDKIPLSFHTSVIGKMVAQTGTSQTDRIWKGKCGENRWFGGSSPSPLAGVDQNYL